jgi:AraC-like DNA-binding protein
MSSFYSRYSLVPRSAAPPEKTSLIATLREEYHARRSCEGASEGQDVPARLVMAELAQIAFLPGFSDQGSFTRSFKRWTGMSSRQFRKSFDKS